MSSDGVITQLSDPQVKVLASLSLVSGLLSVLGSSMIIYLVVKSPKTNPYKRILFGLAASDFISSISVAVEVFMLPQETSTRVWARGNDTSCSVSGFLAQLGVATFWYNGMLSYYYLATIRFGIQTDAFAKRYEPIGHTLSIGYNLVTAVVGLVLGFYREGELALYCWVAYWPENCEETDTCKSAMIGWIYGGMPFLFLILSIFINNIIIYRFVKSKMRRVRRSSMRGTGFQKRKINEVAKQAFLYVGTFTAAYAWTFILNVARTSMEKIDERKLFPLLVLQAIFFPLQGFFNLCVYTRPNYARIRTRFPHCTRRWALRRAWFGVEMSSSFDQPSNLVSREVFGSATKNNINNHPPYEKNASLPSDANHHDRPIFKADDSDDDSDGCNLDNLSSVSEEEEEDNISTADFGSDLSRNSRMSNQILPDEDREQQGSGFEPDKNYCKETN